MVTESKSKSGVERADGDEERVMLPSGTWWRTREPETNCQLSRQVVVNDGGRRTFLMVKTREEDCFYCARRHWNGDDRDVFFIDVSRIIFTCAGFACPGRVLR